MSETPEIDVHHQAAFSEDGELEVTETSVETSLEDFGAKVDHHERKSRRDQPTPRYWRWHLNYRKRASRQ